MIYFFCPIYVRGTPPARRERGELSFAPAPVLQAAGGGLSNNRWSLAGLTPSATVRRLPPLDRLGSARPVIQIICTEKTEMKIAILTSGTRGDVQPYIALGKALRTRGHDVLLACPDNFASWVEGHGLEFRSIGVDMQAFLQLPEGREVLSGNPFTLIKIWRKTIIPLMRGTLDAT